jgi:cob(I)alamin adenosyltransferase
MSTGNDGTTGIFGSDERLRKSDKKVQLMGYIDSLNTKLGSIVAKIDHNYDEKISKRSNNWGGRPIVPLYKESAKVLTFLQHKMFDLGVYLADNRDTSKSKPAVENSNTKSQRLNARILRAGVWDEEDDIIGTGIGPGNGHHTFVGSTNVIGDGLPGGAEPKSIFDHEEIMELLEYKIKELNKVLPKLRQFILPGGTKLSMLTHEARAFCRHTECMFAVEYLECDDSLYKYQSRMDDDTLYDQYYGILSNDHGYFNTKYTLPQSNVQATEHLKVVLPVLNLMSTYLFNLARLYNYAENQPDIKYRSGQNWMELTKIYTGEDSDDDNNDDKYKSKETDKTDKYKSKETDKTDKHKSKCDAIIAEEAVNEWYEKEVRDMKDKVDKKNKATEANKKTGEECAWEWLKSQAAALPPGNSGTEAESQADKQKAAFEKEVEQYHIEWLRKKRQERYGGMDTLTRKTLNVESARDQSENLSPYIAKVIPCDLNTFVGNILHNQRSNESSGESNEISSQVEIVGPDGITRLATIIEDHVGANDDIVAILDNNLDTDDPIRNVELDSRVDSDAEPRVDKTDTRSDARPDPKPDDKSNHPPTNCSAM